MAIPTLASTVALSACKESAEPVTWVGIEVAPETPDDYPEAKFVEGSFQRVISPYTGDEIDVSKIPPGSLVTDPAFPAADNKFFRVPEIEIRPNLKEQ